MIYLPVLVCIIGAVVYLLSENPKVQKLANDAYWWGLGVSLFVFATKSVEVFR